MPDLGELRSRRAHPAVWIGWLLAGLSWTVAEFLPWASSGLMSRSSLLDAAQFAADGAVDEWVPAGAWFAALLPVLTGVLLVGLAGIAGRAARIARLATGLLGTVAVVVLAVRVGELPGTGGGLGAGAWLALAGAGAAAAALVADVAIWIAANGRNAPREAPGSH